MTMKLALKIVVFSLLVPGTVAIVGPMLLLRWTHEWSFAHWGPMQWVGVFLSLLGFSAYAWCAYDFGAAGKGTPAPIDPPRTLVVRGLYRYSRNPMYLGVLCCILGEALFFESLSVTVYACMIFAGFHTFVQAYEEPKLHALFGEAFDAYCARVPRWAPRLLSRFRRRE
jgi:protein-S-isoprenylcysteine O-methyltransferase Ste14